MFDTLITGGTVVHADGMRTVDVAIAEGRIAALPASGESPAARSVVDAAGCYVLPGLVDAHAHLREPGLTGKEDFGSGTHAAALGGITTILDMPTDDPWTATAGQLAEKMALAAGRIHVDVGFQAVLSHDPARIDALLALGPVSFELFTADVPDAFMFATIDAVAEVLVRFRGVDTLVGISPGDQSLLSGHAVRDTRGDIAAFLQSRPPLAEANGIARAILAAATTGTRIHVRQVNSALGAATWRRMRDLADVSVETTPQNLYFTAADYEGSDGPRLKASPPFRAAEDVAALRQALREGLIDMVATDHAPHTPAEKARAYPAFADIPGGMPGLQTLLPVMLKLVEDEVIGLPDMVGLGSTNPAERFGLGSRKGRIAVGRDADILILDPARPSTISHAQQVSKAGYTPFDGWSVGTTLRQVFLRGREIVRDGALLGPASGEVVRRPV